MSNFSISRMFNILQKTVTAIVIFAMIGIASGAIFARFALADHTVDGNGFTNVTATPNSGTLTAGQQLQIDLTISGLDTTDTNPITSPTCLVNGVEVSSTYVNLTSGSDGHFRFTYTVGAIDTDRNAGQVPINCTLVQSHTVTVTAFDDSNTVAINASGNLGADTTAPTVSSTNPSNNATNVALNSTISATFSEAMNASTLSIDSFIVTHPTSGGSIAGSVSYSGNTATFTPGFPLIADTVYTAQITTDAQDVSDNALASTVTWNFTTAANATTNTGPGNNAKLDGNATTNLDFPTSASPSSGTLTTGQTLTVQFTDSSNSTTATSTSCLINGVNTASNFHNVQAGLYQTTYTVGASDSSATAGNVTIDCMINGDQHTIEVVRFNDSNTVAIDASGNNTTAPTLSSVSLSPNSGMVQAGDVITVTFTATNGETDLALTGTCKINAVSVAGSFVNNNNGTYTVSYTVGANDGERPAGHIPVTCTLGNSGGNVTASAWNDSNTLAIDTNDDGFVDNGENNLGFTITASPSSGTLGVGSQLVISMQDPLPSGDVTIVPAGTVGPGSITVSNGCLVNDVDVSGSYAYFGNGLYKVTYTVGASDENQTAGNIPFDCTLSNHTGSVHLVAFTDSNTVAVNTSASVATLSSIAITTPATKLNYTVGESLDISGLVVTGTYSDNSTQVQNITTANVTGFNSSSTATNQVLTITVDGKTTTYNVNIAAAPLQSSAKAITAFSFSSGTGVINETNHTITVNVPYGTSVTALVPTFTTTGTGVTVSGTTQTSGTTSQNFTSPVTYRVTAQNGTTQDYVVTVNVLPQGTGSATLNNSSPQVTISSSTQPMVIVVASGTTSPTINVSSLISGGTGILPAISITTASNVVVTIPASTTITGDLTWNEIISAPTSTTITLPTTGGQTRTLSMAIELGSTGKLSFNKGVRILFPGQAGKKIGYVRSGIDFTEITATCAADNQTTGDALGADADCKIDVGADLVVWTKHFTTFATYTQTSVGGGNNGLGGGGGGGGSSGFIPAAAFNPVVAAIVQDTGCSPGNIYSTTTGRWCGVSGAQISQVAQTAGQVLGASTFKFTKKLKLGMSGVDVTELQNKLTELGYYTGKIDGKFGKKTRTALMKFQKAQGLKADGIMGAATMAALNI